MSGADYQAMPGDASDVGKAMANMNSLIANQKSGLHDFGALILRVVTALCIVHHGIDKLDNFDSFTKHSVEDVFGKPLLSGVRIPVGKNETIGIHGLPALPGAGDPDYSWIYTQTAAYIEIVGSVFLLLGILTRLTSMLLWFVLSGALYWHLYVFGSQHFPLPPKSTPAPYTFEPCLALGAACFYFFLGGGGRFSCW